MPRASVPLLLLLSCAARGGLPPEAPSEQPTAPAEPPSAFTAETPPAPAEPDEAAPSGPPTPPPEPDRSQPPWSQTPTAPLAEGEVERSRAAGGRHLRIGTARGSIHVWLPRGYVARTAGIVVYVHGYYTGVDQAFVDHRLAEQFRASRRNALFLAAEAPAWNGAAVTWPDLSELLDEVGTRSGFALPRGPLVVAGHSGAIRTVLSWLLHPRVEEIVLLDGLYRGEGELAAWLAGGPHVRRRLLLVGQETAERTEAWLPSMKGAIFRHRVPARLPAADRRALLVYYRSQHDHMAIIAGGRVLPLLLGSTRLRAL